MGGMPALGLQAGTLLLMPRGYTSSGLRVVHKFSPGKSFAWINSRLLIAFSQVLQTQIAIFKLVIRILDPKLSCFMNKLILADIFLL